MNLQKALFSFFLFSYSMLSCHMFNQLIIPSVNLDEPNWQFAYQQIHLKEESSLTDLVEKWNDILENKWEKLNQLVFDELGATADQISQYLTDPMFVQAYINFYKKWHPELFEDQEIDPVVLNFLHLKLHYLRCYKSVYFKVDNDMPMMTSSFGTDSTNHCFIINERMYNQDNIEALYAFANKKIMKFHVVPHQNFHKSRAIEYANLIHIGIIQSLSSVLHQSDFFVKLLSVIMYNNNILSEETQKFGYSYLTFISYLETALQSKNPLEVALFLEPQTDNFYYDFIELWQEFMQDLQSCYDEDDLEAYEALSREQRRIVMYQDQDNDEDKEIEEE